MPHLKPAAKGGLKKPTLLWKLRGAATPAVGWSRRWNPPEPRRRHGNDVPTRSGAASKMPHRDREDAMDWDGDAVRLVKPPAQPSKARSAGFGLKGVVADGELNAAQRQAHTPGRVWLNLPKKGGGRSGGFHFFWWCGVVWCGGGGL
jgi:hypothetical protein